MKKQKQNEFILPFDTRPSATTLISSFKPEALKIANQCHCITWECEAVYENVKQSSQYRIRMTSVLHLNGDPEFYQLFLV